jgi:hypothetical protein
VHNYWTAATTLGHGNGQRPGQVQFLDPLAFDKQIRSLIDLDIRRRSAA